MKVRTYIEERCSSSNGRQNCAYLETPIIDWEYPERLSKHWQVGTPIPSSENITVTFPELFLLNEYEQYKEAVWRYSIEMEENDFVELVVPQNRRFDTLDENSFDDKQQRKVHFQVRYKNFDNLPEQGKNILIWLRAYAADTKIEERKITISLAKTQQQSAPSPQLPVLNMVYNAVTKELSSDDWMGFLFNPLKTPVSVRFSHFLSQEPVNLPPDINNQVICAPFIVEFTYLGNGHRIRFVGVNESSLTDGVYNGVDFRQNQTIQTQPSQNVFTQIYSSSRFPFLPNRTSEDFSFIINLTITNDPFYFEIDKKSFRYELFREDKGKAKGRFVIKNSNLLTFSFEKSDFLNITSVSGNGSEQVIVDFESNTADTFPMGEHRGYIKVGASPESQQVVSVFLQIKQDIDFQLGQIYFCKDKNLMTIRRTHPEAEFVRAEIKMLFSGYGRNFENTQRYDYVFFEEYVTIDIGDEVQDFFEDIPSLEVLNVNENRLLQPKEIFKATRVDITLTETNFKGEAFKTHTFTDLHFLPGKKPEAFPFLTRATLRSTYSQSLISVCALTRDVKALNLNEIASNLVDLSLLKDTLGIANFVFRRNVADKTYNAESIIAKENLSLEPKPEPNNMLIDAIFQNQNFCPDWFSFTDDYEAFIDFEHTIADNVLKSEDYKAFVKTKRTFKLNTGWIFPEEVELLWELIQSPLCYLKINGKWTKVIPITQKPLSFDSYRNLHNMIVEFQLADKE